MDEDVRLPPFSEEAERGALGAMLTDGLRLVPVARRLGVGPASFYVPANRQVCEAIYEAAEKKGGVDVLLVQERLRVKGELERIGGGIYLDRLVLDTPSAAHGEYYLDIVRQMEVSRQALRLMQAGEKECYGEERGDQVAARIADSLMNLVDREGPAEESNLAVLQRHIARWRAAKNGEQPAIGLPLPWGKLTELLCGLEPGMTILAGRPSMGKTTVEDQICVELAAKGIPVGRVTLDSTRDELLVRSTCRLAGVSLPKLKFGYGRENQLADVEEAAKAVAEYPIYINDRDTDISVICPWARMMRARYGIELLTVDYLQIVMASVMGRSQWDQVGRVTYVSGMLKRLAVELGIPVLVLSQLNRGSSKDGKLRPPTLADLRDSGALEQDAHKVVAVYRDEKRAKQMEEDYPGATKHHRPTWLNVLKQKDGETGKLSFWFLPHYFRFVETDPDFVLEDPENEDEGLMAEFDDTAYERPRAETTEWDPDQEAEFAPAETQGELMDDGDGDEG